MVTASPSMVSVQVAGSMLVGIRPLLRRNIRSAGVTSSSSRWAGVSMFQGLSFRMVRPVCFPSFFRASSLPSCSSSAGSSPPGMCSANTMGPPSTAAMALSPVRRRKPRRETGSLSRPNSKRSASIGSSAYSRWMFTVFFSFMRGRMVPEGAKEAGDEG